MSSMLIFFWIAKWLVAANMRLWTNINAHQDTNHVVGQRYRLRPILSVFFSEHRRATYSIYRCWLNGDAMSFFGFETWSSLQICYLDKLSKLLEQVYAFVKFSPFNLFYVLKKSSETSYISQNDFMKNENKKEEKKRCERKVTDGSNDLCITRGYRKRSGIESYVA